MNNITNNNPTCCVIGVSECCYHDIFCSNVCYNKPDKPKSIREQIEKDTCDGCQ